MRIFLTLFFFLMFFHGFCQVPLTEAERATLDSMLKEDAFFNMVKDAMKPKSYVAIALSAGNNSISEKIKTISASTAGGKVFFIPAVSYFHKSGLGLSLSAYFTRINNRSDIYQYNITGSYTVTKSKRVGAAFSYLHSFSNHIYKTAVSPISNELYATAWLKKLWLGPGIPLGFSGGKTDDIILVDTIFAGVRRIFSDSVNTTTWIFSSNAFIEHSFEYYKILNKDDGISITPKLILNAGSDKYSETHHNPYITFLKRTRLRKNNFGRLEDNTSFTIQSLALDLDIAYVFKKFSVEPQAYLEYYFPEVTGNKLTLVYSVTVGYTF